MDGFITGDMDESLSFSTHQLEMQVIQYCWLIEIGAVESLVRSQPHFE